LKKHNYELAARWLERAHDVLGEQDWEMLSPEVGELRLSTIQGIGTDNTLQWQPQLMS
jgi:hypothetical protein